ncbi:uncharacterized protein B0I36DRAFT_355466 [Microdochium trichocladiopsis]|uniref:Kelch repeat protein n=1 Tax=Microdochium trichocladiopsis TaxID=1682393 RepID=A0A9P8XUX9_9PEZI|nr:uncharacterized protein B0I36DRAFT_355466 [Microdochium trichocladiopsis]KAH7014218.1 hypothetical protein B0I36DRAFT_355466 [Microdochium trichocladiopsis]
MRVPWPVAIACSTVTVAAAAASQMHDDEIRSVGDGASTSSSSSAHVEARQASGNPAVDSFIRRFHPSAARLGDYLYVDGGSISRLVNDSSQVRAMNATVAIPLNEAWTNQTLTMREIDRTLLPNVNLPVLWADPAGNALYTYGGDSIGTNSTYTRAQQYFKFTPAGGGRDGSWSEATPADAFKFSQLYKPARSAFTSCNGVGYSLGGYAYGGTDDRFSGADSGLPLAGMATYDFATRLWDNVSLADAFSGGNSAGGMPGYYPTNGAAVCLPDLGGAGALMFFGGRGLSANGRDSVPLQLNDMLIYDIAGKRWLWQGTRGADGAAGVPRHRRDACAAVGRGRNGTYEV